MSRIKTKPHQIFWISIPILILFGILYRNEMLNVNIYDTYFVFSKTDLAILIAILFAVIGLGYWIMLKFNIMLSKRLNLIHIILTFGGILIIWILAQLFREPVMESDFNNILTLVIYLIAFLTILGQLILPINIINALINKRN